MAKSKRKPKIKLGHWFIPHALNDHRPHLIRAHGLAVLALLIFGVQATALATRPSVPGRPASGHVLAYATDINPAALLTQTNQIRVQNGLPALHLSSLLVTSAGLKGQDMFQEDYWAHVSPTGIEPWYWFGKAGYAYSYAGENLAKDFDTTSGVMAGWMNSPGHKANILNPHYSDVGFAVQNGILVGGETTLVVAHYGAVGATVVAAPTPAPATPAATPAPTPAPTPAVSASPSPSASASPVAALGSTTPAAPAPKQYSIFAPLSLSSTLNWGTLITLLLLLLLLGVYAITHITVWRKGLIRWEKAHYKLLAGFQLAGLTTVILLLAGSGFGSVG